MDGKALKGKKFQKNSSLNTYEYRISVCIPGKKDG